MRIALHERGQLMEARASELVEQAIRSHDPWIGELGEEPRGAAAESWRRHARVVAAYRDRYGVVGRSVLGPSPASAIQREGCRDGACGAGERSAHHANED